MHLMYYLELNGLICTRLARRGIVSHAHQHCTIKLLLNVAKAFENYDFLQNEIKNTTISSMNAY